MLGPIANGLKDRVIEAIVKGLINQKIEALGSVTSLQIDSKARTISAQLALKGETQAIEIKAGAYELVEESGVAYISFKDLQASKEWIGNVLNQYVGGRRFKVPGVVRMAL